MEPDQVHLIAVAVTGDLQQGLDAFESRFASEIVGDVAKANRHDRVDDDVAVVHLIAAAGLDVRTHPHTHAAPDSAPPDPLAEPFREDHEQRYCACTW